MPVEGEANAVETAWPLRAWALMVIGGLIALAIQQLIAMPEQGWSWGPRLVSAASMSLGIGGLAFGLAWDKGRLPPAIVMALLCGAVAGGSFVWNGLPNGVVGANGWHLFCGVLASAFMLTLFQAGEEHVAEWPTGWSIAALNTWTHKTIHYPAVYGHLWGNALLLGLSGLFSLLVLGVAHLLAEMFWLVKLDLLRIALRQPWFNAVLVGASVGAALGLLRDRGAIIAALQRVAMLVLSVLAPVVAVAILIFLAVLPFTGFAPLWDTGRTTPIMLVGALLALFLLNVVVGERASNESRSLVLGASAIGLGVVLLPMVVIAVFSTWLRIEQYGFSPDRLWALTFDIVMGVVALAYLVAILGGRGWFARLRRTNLAIIVILAGVALLLSTPLLGFERIATAQQLARLDDGRVSAEVFDYKALQFDYGPPGRAAIKRLATSSPNAVVRDYATKASQLENRWEEAPNATELAAGTPLMERLTILPEPVPLDAELRNRLLHDDACGGDANKCVLRYVPGQDYAVVIRAPAGRCNRCDETIALLYRTKRGWSSDIVYLANGGDSAVKAAAIRAGQVEMRLVQQRQLFINGKPAGAPIALENAAEP